MAWPLSDFHGKIIGGFSHFQSMKTTYIRCPACKNYSLNKATQKCENRRCSANPSIGVGKMVKRYTHSITYLLIFLLLVYFSPFRHIIYSKEFIRSFQIIEVIGNLIKKGKTEFSDLNPPTVSYPLKESSTWIKGKGASWGSLVTIYINDKPRLTVQADKEGNFECEMGHQLKSGDTVTVRQMIYESFSPISPPIFVTDDDYKLAKLKMDEEREKIRLIESSCTLLISWSVLIIGGLSYIILYRRGSTRFLWIIPFIIFLIVMSIYYGISTKGPIISAMDKYVPVLSITNLHVYWWKQIEFFERGLFLACILLVWNLGAPAVQIKEDAQ